VDRLAGKVAVVTGGATGLGRAIAVLYAEEGAKVVVGDRRAEEGQETVDRVRGSGGEAIFVRTDVTVGNDVKALVEAAESTYGRVHVMTANAGILGRSVGVPFADVPEDDFNEVMAVNFSGVVNAFKHAIPAIQRSGGGAMTATGSVTSHRGRARADAYCASKHAVLGLVRSLAIDLAPAIRVNLVSPGNMATEIGRHAAESRGETVAPRPKPPGSPRAADPREGAHVHLFLVSDEGRFVNGQSIVADDGWTVSLPNY
jgi:NAD(P)-dependent dehydrogenase (short-subunit alcohol dehydrogenase family)